jgi:hypothetical protein
MPKYKIENVQRFMQPDEDSFILATIFIIIIILSDHHLNYEIIKMHTWNIYPGIRMSGIWQQHIKMYKKKFVNFFFIHFIRKTAQNFSRFG